MNESGIWRPGNRFTLPGSRNGECQATCATLEPMTSGTRPRRVKAINFKHRRYVVWLAGILAIITLLLGIAPWHRQDWLLENALVVPAVLVLWAIYRHVPFSRLSWTLVFAFLCLHEVGA